MVTARCDTGKGESVIIYRCTRCGFISEQEANDDTVCSCCKFAELLPLTNDRVSELLDVGELVYCEACQRIHSGAMDMIKEKNT